MTALPDRPRSHRRSELFAARERLNGIDYVEVLDGGTALCVHFFGDVPTDLGVENIVIGGGRRIRNLVVLAVQVQSSKQGDLDDCLHVTIDREGDFSTYRLCIVDPDAPDETPAGFDPRYVCADLRFRIDCSDGQDCAAPEPALVVAASSIEIDYLAKDYATIRQLILDRLATTIPDWRERHAADIGVTLVELLAYAADQLSYYQDAVATESYLGTARRRISVRRHTALVDYRLGEGTNARTWVTVWTDSDTPEVASSDLLFATALPDPVDGRVSTADDVLTRPASTYRAFEAVTDRPTLVFRAAHSEIAVHTWGGEECRLTEGATHATLVDDDGHGCRILCLEPGDVLFLEEVKGPVTGEPPDADPTHRHAVRLTRVHPTTDPLLDVCVLDVEWDDADALPFTLTLSARLPAPGCEVVDGISVARGNVVLVDHGRTVFDDLDEVPAVTVAGACACEGSLVELTELPAQCEPTLARTPLTWAEPVEHTCPAATVTVRHPDAATPAVSLSIDVPDSDAPAQEWTPVPDLLSSDRDARNFVVEIDDDGGAHLRFGDDELGMRPPPHGRVTATYRIGNGTAGNVGRDTIVTLAVRGQSWTGIDVRPRNPLPATGGTDAEPIAAAKLFAPHAFRSRLRRAITAEDYARIAELRGGLRAAGQLVWTGSWYAARVGIDPDHTDDVDPALLADVAGHLHPFRRMGHDLEVVAATKVPLDVALHICVDPHHARGDIRRAVRAALVTGRSGGRLALFHPDSLTFGTDVHVSEIVSAAQAVEGVVSVSVTRLRRWGEPDEGALLTGVLEIGPMEVAQLADDRNFADHGKLDLADIGGGR